MLQQKIQNRQPDALRGIGLVLLIALAAVAGSAFFSRLEARLGTLASLLFILYGCAIAWFLLNWYAMSFIYTATADCLRVCRAYGKRERFMADVWLNQVVAYGTPDEVKRRCPDAHATHATRSQCAFEPLALAYKEDGKTRVIVIQPDDALRAHLTKALKKNMK
ncbi:MAG: hypothetical protein IJ769_00505 [Clostridia bacterium]|nr:hypothetical protein [Clostridia bacterium]